MSNSKSCLSAQETERIGHEALIASKAWTPPRQNERFQVPVIQFLMPHGERRETSTNLPVSCRELFNDMTRAGCRFEAEMLTTLQVSITISNPQDEEDIDISVTLNGPDVQAGMIAMLERQLWEAPSVGDGEQL